MKYVKKNENLKLYTRMLFKLISAVLSSATSPGNILSLRKINGQLRPISFSSIAEEEDAQSFALTYILAKNFDRSSLIAEDLREISRERETKTDRDREIERWNAHTLNQMDRQTKTQRYRGRQRGRVTDGKRERQTERDPYRIAMKRASRTTK